MIRFKYNIKYETNQINFLWFNFVWFHNFLILLL